jgi:hypothetical protein
MANTNSACPATASFVILSSTHSPLQDHITLVADYAPGPLGDNITHQLGYCCNSTVEVFFDSNSELPSKCNYYCNATIWDNRNSESGYTFRQAQQCIASLPGAKTYPKGYGKVSTAAGASGPGLAGLCLVGDVDVWSGISVRDVCVLCVGGSVYNPGVAKRENVCTCDIIACSNYTCNLLPAIRSSRPTVVKALFDFSFTLRASLR